MNSAWFKKHLISILVINLLATPVLALELDTSLDDEIRRNYNPNKIEEDMALPTLPKIINDTNTQSIKQITPNTAHTSPQMPISELAKQDTVKLKATQRQTYAKESLQENYATIKKGTKIRAKLLTNISDRTKKGTKISFVSQYPVTTTYFTIPMGTTFKGEVINSHRPQLSGNGGLIVVKVNSVEIKNEIYPINANITAAGDKKIFLNNIKGKRKYVSSMFKSMRPGCHFFKKMVGVSWDLARDGSSILVSPFSLALGAVAAGGNIAISPAIALFSKGENIFLNSGSNIEIKLMQDVFIYK